MWDSGELWHLRRMAVEKVLVVGAGFMGSGIAQVCAQASYHVHLMDVQAAIVDKALQEIRRSVEKLAAKGLIQDAPAQVLARITPETDLSSAAQVDWVIEAVWEEFDLKRKIFVELDRITRPETVLATNSSS